MSIEFTCDGCGDKGAPGTVTGGMPGQWTCRYEYERAAGGSSKRCTRILHYCAACREAGRDRPDAAAPAPAPVPETKTKAPARRRRKAAKKKPKPDPSPDDQVDLF